MSRTCSTFATRYSEKQKSSPNTVKHILENLKNYGSVKAKMQRRKPVVDDENIEIVILGYFHAFPRMSLRQAALESGLCKDSIHRILLKHKFHSFSFHMVQGLKGTDFLRRQNLCVYSNEV